MGLRAGAARPGQLSPTAARPPAALASDPAQDAERRLDELQERLRVRFRNRALLREAMTHASWVNERGETGADNERLEYLGDAVLELVAGEYLFRRFPTYDEGQLTQLRSSLVNTQALAKLGEQLQLGETLRMGRGAAKTGARRLTSLLANAFEALIGAAFLDQGYRVAGRIFLSRIGDLRDWTDTNFKGRLQALAQERFGSAPAYRIVATGGPGHSREYVAEAVLDQDRVLGVGRGGTKQAAQQAAARAAIDALTAPPPGPRRRRRRGSRTAGGTAAPLGSAAPGSDPSGPEPADGGAPRPDPAGGPALRPALAETPAPRPDAGEIDPVRPPAAAGRRRRRSRTAPSPAADALAPTVAPEPPDGETGEATATSEAVGEPRKRTRRGHRGGRRRSGRAGASDEPGPVSATPLPSADR